MPKITNQSGLTTNNFVLGIVALTQRTTIAIAVAGGTMTITDTANTFISAGFAVGDRISIRFANPANPNNGFATIATVAAGTITCTVASHTNTPTAQSAGQACVVERVKKTFRFLEADGLSFIDGVSGTALASEFQTLWDTGGFERYSFPYVERRPDAETLEFVAGWEPFNNDTLYAIRDAALIIRDGETNAIRQEFANFTAPAFYGGTGTARYWQSPGGTITPFVTGGYLNQPVLIRDVPNSIDRRNYFVAKLAEPGRTVEYYDLFVEQPDTETLTAKKYNIVLNDQLDLQLANPDGSLIVSDVAIASTAPYTSITYTRHSPSVTRNIEGTDYSFNAIIARTGATKRQAHAKLNWLVRQWGTDIDSGAGSLLGGHSPALSQFVGEEITFQGFADGTPAAERNETVFTDSTGLARRFTRIAAFTFDLRVVAAGLTSGSATFRVFLQSVFNTANASPMLDSDNNPVQGTITGDTTRSFSVRFSTFNQFGHPPGTPIPIIVTLSAPGRLRNATYQFTINDNTTQVFQVVGVETTAWRAAA